MPYIESCIGRKDPLDKVTTGSSYLLIYFQYCIRIFCQLLHNPFLLCLSGPETDLHSVSVQWWSQIKTAGIVREGDLTGWPACHTVFTIQQYIHTYASSTIFVHFLPGHTLPSSATLLSCQVYGYEYLPVLISLRKAGLLSLQEGKTHQSIRRQFRLLVEPTGRVCEKHKQIFTSLRIFYSQHFVALLLV